MSSMSPSLPQSNSAEGSNELIPVVQQTLETITTQHLTSIIHDAVRLQRKSKRQKICDVDVHLALRSRCPQNINGMSLIPMHLGGSTGATSGKSSNAVDLNSFLQSEMNVSCPQEPGLAVHWLSVDGIQPLIPMNVVATTVGRNQDDEIEGENNKVNGISMNRLLPHLLSEELQIYYNNITLAVKESKEGSTLNLKQLKLALNSVRNDTGVQELVPFFVKFVTNNIYENLEDVEYLRIILRLADCMICNPSLHLELHVSGI